jgi:protein-tyrosine kinase
MSKNFELMQQISKDQGSRSSHTFAPDLAGLASNVNDNREPAAPEDAQLLVQRIFLGQTEQPPHMVVFAGVDHGDGCSHICASVAETLARNGNGAVCLVEANFRSPALPALFGTTNHHGLTDALVGREPIRSFAKPVHRDNLWLLSCGSLSSYAQNVLNVEGLKTRFAELKCEFDFIVVDAPPLTKYADAITLGQLTDGLVMVLAADSTRRETALAAAASLRSSQVKILGAVLNKRSFPIPKSIYSRL